MKHPLAPLYASFLLSLVLGAAIWDLGHPVVAEVAIWVPPALTYWWIIRQLDKRKY